MSGFGPVGSAAVGAAGPTLDSAINEDLADAAGLASAIRSTIPASLTATAATSGALHAWIWPSIAETLTAGAMVEGKTLDNLVARLSAVSAIEMHALLAAKASDGASLMGAVVAAWQLLLEEEISTVGEALATVRKFAALADALAATGQATGNMTAFVNLVQAVTLEGLIRLGFSPDLVDEATLASNTDANARLLGQAMDGLFASDSAAAIMRISAVATEGVEIDSAAQALLRANVDLADGILIYVTIRLGGVDYVGWALNTDALAASEHRGAAFDSYVSFKGKDYAAGPNGLVEFGGATDDGEAIDWSLRTFLTDFGTGKFKRVPDCYIVATTTGTLALKVITRDPGTGVQTEDWYCVVRAPEQGPGTGRVKIGRGLKSTWWGFELVPINGADLEGLDSLSLRPLILDRRV